MSHAAAVSDNIESGVLGLQMLIDLNLHVVELNLDTIKQSVIIGSSGCNLIKGVYHLDDTIQDSLWKH